MEQLLIRDDEHALVEADLDRSDAIFSIKTTAMEAQIIFSSEVAQVEVHPRQQLIKLTWKGNASGKTYREPSLAVLKAVQDLQLKYFLSDARGMGPILFADRSFSEKEIIPKLIEAGLVRIAIVSSTDGLNVIAVDNMVNTIPMGTTTVAFFDDMSAGQRWLLGSDAGEVSVRASGGKGAEGLN